MTASETGREIPADELATGLRSDAASINSLRRKTPRDVEDAVRYTAAADLIEAQAARIASLEAERARAVEAYRAGVEETCREWATPESWSDAESTQQGLDDRKRAAWAKKEMMKDWRVARALTLASEKGGQADG